MRSARRIPAPLIEHQLEPAKVVPAEAAADPPDAALPERGQAQQQEDEPEPLLRIDLTHVRKLA